MGDDELDAEFRRLTSELEASDEFPDPADFPDLPPDDQPALPKRVCIGLVLAPVDNAAALAALLKLSGHDVRVVPTDPWAAAWIPIDDAAGGQMDDEVLLLTGRRPLPEAVDTVARVVSKLTPYGAVAVVSWLRDGDGADEGPTGDIVAQRFVGGEPEEYLEAGILMNQLGDEAEELLLGRKTPDDFPDEESGWRRFFRRPRGSR